MDVEDTDPVLCPSCSGCGEDPRTGIPCWQCRGKGEIPTADELDRFNDALADAIEDREWHAELGDRS